MLDIKRQILKSKMSESSQDVISKMVDASYKTLDSHQMLFFFFNQKLNASYKPVDANQILNQSLFKMDVISRMVDASQKKKNTEFELDASYKTVDAIKSRHP